MAKVEIDSTKMWESIKKELWHWPQESWLDNCIDKALKDQGLTWDAETKEIVSIEPNEKETIKAGNWYVCNCPIVNDNSMTVFQ